MFNRRNLFKDFVLAIRKNSTILDYDDSIELLRSIFSQIEALVIEKERYKEKSNELKKNSR